MEYRYYTLEKRNGAYRVYGWSALPDVTALQLQDFERDIVATFPDEEQARRAYPQARTILRGKSLLLRPTWPEEQAQQPKALWSIPDTGHIGALRSAGVRKRLAEFLRLPTDERLAALSTR